MNEIAKAGWIKELPITHRGLHDASRKVFENSPSAVRAAIDARYAIEVDIQPSLEMIPMVFHDYTLDRMTAHDGEIRKTHKNDLASMTLGNSTDCIWTLSSLLALVGGKVPIVIELKGQKDGDEGFAKAVVEALAGYEGNFALMSFNHWLLEDVRNLVPNIILGLTAEGDEKLYATHFEIVNRLDLDFVSYRSTQLNVKFVREFHETGKPVLCWTVKDQKAADEAYKLCDQITFEGFLPADGRHPEST